MHRTFRSTALIAALFATPLTACYAEVEPDTAYAEADFTPVAIETYPHGHYEGHDVYFVNDRWYYRSGPHWVYYRHEPAPLVRSRTYVQRAPRARIEHSRGPERGVRSAPPATVVR
jgi:hypothetical protein